ncbi:MAG: M23 family metallopeptidase, partial [Bradymonadaceae bacterium]
PRIKVSEDRYDFHRGLDLPAEENAAIYAVADGTARLAGEDEEYSDPVVQIAHQPDQGEVYYSNYLHISSWSVEAGQTVEQGDKIGEVGRSASGFPHLHFEIREGGFYRHHCAHPLSYLPYEQTDPPAIDRVRVDWGGETGRVAFSVQLPHTEL